MRRPNLPPVGTRRPFLFASTLTVLFFGAGGAWSAMAPLESAALAPGVIVVESHTKTVSHLDGGTVAQVLVHDQDRVKAGQVLIRLDKTVAQATLDLYQGQLIATEAESARLVAERDWRGKIAFPKLLVDSPDPRAATAMAAERGVFHAQRDQLEGQTQILWQKKAQLDEEIRGLKAEIAAEDQELALMKEEIAGARKLFAKGLEPKPKLLALERQAADIAGARGQNVAKIAEAKQQQGEAALKVIDLRAKMLSDAVSQLSQDHTKISDLTQKVRAAEDSLRHTDIKAPISGQVEDLKVYTVGSSIAPNEPLMTIVPQGEPLAVQAKVSVHDIDVVHPGLPVTLKFSSLNTHTTPTITGRVTKVAADRTVDQRTGQSYYTVQIAMGSTTQLPKDVALTPGMPVEAMIRTGSGTFLEYLVKPIAVYADKALHET